MFFAWHILNESILFWLTFFYQKPFVFSVFYSQIFTLKLNFRQKICLTYAISKVKWFSGVLSKKTIFTFLCWIWMSDVSQQYCENFRKIEQEELVEKLPPSYLSYRSYFCIICIHFYYGKKWKYFDFFFFFIKEYNFLCIYSYDKWFWQKFANLLLTDVKSKVD